MNEVDFDDGFVCKDRYNGIKPSELKQIRTSLGFSQRDAGLIFGGGVNAFYRYERGKVSIPKSIDLLFTLLDKNYITLDDLVEAKHGKDKSCQNCHIIDFQNYLSIPKMAKKNKKAA